MAAASIVIPSSIYTSLVLTESAAYLASQPRAARRRPRARAPPGPPARAARRGRPRLRDAAAIRGAPAGLPRRRPARVGPRRRASAVPERRRRAVADARLRCGDRRLRVRAPAPDELAAGRILRRLRGSLARVRPVAGRQVCRLPPRCMGDLPVRRPVRWSRRSSSSSSCALRGAAAEREGAFVAAFLTVNAATVLIAAAFASTPYGYSELHDRYALLRRAAVARRFAVWLARGMPRPLPLTAAASRSPSLLPAILPFGLIGGNLVVEVVPTALWSWVWTVVEATPQLDGRRVLGICVCLLVVAAVAVPRRALARLAGARRLRASS